MLIEYYSDKVVILKYIYLDESGDLDLSCRSGDYFVIAALCANDHRPIHNCITRIKKCTSKKYYKKHELHFSEAEHKLRRRVLECVIRNDIGISYLVFNKNEFIKNNTSGFIPTAGNLKDALFLIFISKTIAELNIKGNPKIIIDRYLSLDRVDKFNDIFHQIIGNNQIIGDDLKIKNDVITEHVRSYENKGIQAVDFIAGAIHQNYTYNKTSLYNLIEPKIQYGWILDKNMK